MYLNTSDQWAVGLKKSNWRSLFRDLVGVWVSCKYSCWWWCFGTIHGKWSHFSAEEMKLDWREMKCNGGYEGIFVWVWWRWNQSSSDVCLNYRAISTRRLSMFFTLDEMGWIQVVNSLDHYINFLSHPTTLTCPKLPFNQNGHYLFTL